MFPECEEFDLLLVAGPETQGFDTNATIGVQAKLVANVKSLYQALPRDYGVGKGTNFYAVLVPRAPEEYLRIARQLKITVFEGQHLDSRYHSDWAFLPWHAHTPKTPVWFPDLEVPGMKGGVGLVHDKLTKWKVHAVQLCVLAEERGYLTKADFAEAETNMALFVAQRWIVRHSIVKMPDGTREYRYKLNLKADIPPPILKYPLITEAVRLSRAQHVGDQGGDLAVR